MTRNEQIMALRGLISFSMIAERLGVSRNTVAGVCWRADWPSSKCVRSPNAKGNNKCGRGRNGPGKPAIVTQRNWAA